MSKTFCFIVGLFLLSCRPSSSDIPRNEQDEFWANLQTLCGAAHEGQVVESAQTDTAFIGKTLVMHARHCADSVMHIAFNAGDNRSRTWIVSRTAEGLRLKHDHRHEDGSEDSVTQYGGDTRAAGTSQQQEFHADAHTISLIPAAATNVWTIIIEPRKHFVYALRREGTDRRVRLEFDLSRTVATPPPSWGH